MKLTKSQLKKIIKEELEALISEEPECSSEAVKVARDFIIRCATKGTPDSSEEDTIPPDPSSGASHMAAPVPLRPGEKLPGVLGKRIRTMAEDKK